MMKILLGITGSIAAYKAPDLVRRLRESGMEVRVVMTKGACAFITPLSLQAVSGYPVTYDLLDPAHEAGMGHIELSRWADLIVVAPCSANTLAKISHGFADDLLSAILLAAPCPIILAPGMNRLMWDNAATQENLERLRQRNINVMAPGSGAQACGEVGLGRMPEPLEIRDYILAHFASQAKVCQKGALLMGKHVVVTAGPTIEPIDPVRYISNHSSGKMGYALAVAARDAGAKVTLISGPVALTAPSGIQMVKIATAKELLAATLEAVATADLFIAAAAVADYYIQSPADQKIKKTDDSDTMTLTLKKNPDILATVAALAVNRPFCVGFAAETHDIINHAAEKLVRKNLDMICLNDVAGGKVFGAEHNEVLMIDKRGHQYAIESAPKADIAAAIMTILSNQL